jgi:hypothetical protein
MLDLILRLIDRLIDLAKKREEVNRAMFVDFVQPAFQIFETVHADYIDSLTRYDARLTDKTLSMDLNHPVFRDLEMDSLKSEHLRTKLKDLRPADAPPKLKPFLTAIDFYLRGVSASGARVQFLDKLASDRAAEINENDLENDLGGKTGLGGHLPGVAFAVLNHLESLDLGSPKGRHVVIFSDPMREALRVALLGFDAPREEDPQWECMLDAVSRVQSNPIDNERRTLCSWAVKGAMRHFQNSYAFVSSAYSALRSELLSST